MTSTAQLFVVSLARASKRARRHLRGLKRADRDDVLATAILWCWENRATYNPAVSLDDWFVGAIRNARKAWKRGEARQASEMVEAVAAPDDTAWSVEVRQAINRLCRSMDKRDKRIVQLSMEGMTQEDIAEQADIPLRTVKRKLARLRSMIPERDDFAVAQRRMPTGDSDTQRGTSKIDKEIEKLEFAPSGGTDCPPCWRCKWFDGYLPAANTARRLPITIEPEIRAAVLDVEARKIEIAYGQRRGWR